MGIRKKMLEFYYSVIRFSPEAPGYLMKNFRTSSSDGTLKLNNLLKEKYFYNLPDDYLETPAGKEDMKDHVTGRLNRFRSTYIPFIDFNKKLNGSRILEIGGGTGCSTLALAEQGADVCSIDIDKDAQEISKLRLTNYSSVATHYILNATDIDIKFGESEFDIVIYFASLEHMTYQERIESLKKCSSIGQKKKKAL